ncbi:MAG: hypothetical protein M9921_14740 [Fimbriimonadaceae bacterium]|nr:hypothetical protein [Fimbriimonadaceae bacterium]
MSIEMLKTAGVAVLLAGVFVVVPIVAILLEHQRRMAKLIRGEKDEPSELIHLLSGTPKSNSQLEARIEALEAEVRELRNQSSLSSLNAP